MIRCYSGYSEWEKAESLSSTTSSLVTDPGQKAILESFSKATGLTLEFSFQCLSEMAWDPQRAHTAFMSAKASLPPHAFLPK